MKSLKFRPKARDDLDEIWDYSIAQWGKDQALGYIAKIQSSCLGLCDGTAVGLSAEHVLEGYRKLHAGSHTIYFKESDDEIQVVRILHQRMDVKQKF